MHKKVFSFLAISLLASSIFAMGSCGGGATTSATTNPVTSEDQTTTTTTGFDPNNDSMVNIIDPKTYTGEKITLRYWNGFTGEDGQGMKDIVAQFNREFEGVIEVDVQSYAWDILFTKLLSSHLSPETAPQVLAMPVNRVLGYVQKEFIMPMPSIEQKLNASRDDYIKSAWDAGYYGLDTRYTFPLDVHPNALFYNKDLISEDEIPTTWEEFLKISKEKTEGTTYGCAIPNEYSITKDIFLSRLVQQGGNIFDENNNVVFNSQLGVDILQEMVDWKYKEGISPAEVGPDGDKILFTSGKSAFYFDGPWVINQLNKISTLEYGVAPMPGSVGEDGISWAGSHQLGICKVAVDSYELKSACYTLIDYISKNSQKWAESGQVPAYTPIHQTDDYKALTKLQAFTQEAYNATFGNVDYKYCYEGYNFVGTAVKNSLNDPEKNTPKASLNNQAMLLQIYIEEDQ